MTLATLVHELGHASACRYGGAQPGRVGIGVYIVFPAFYTDVSDSYRLSRVGRLRTDLGGLYFNVLTALGLGSCYLITGNGFFLLIVVLMQIEMAQQLIPVVRFDGYYILADLTGVPNLFAQIRPSLLALRPGRVRASMDELKPGARRLVRLWVFTVVPLLAISFGWLLWNLPTIITMTISSLGHAIDQAGTAIADGRISTVIISLLSVILLTLPLIGIAVLLWRLGAAAIRWLPKIDFHSTTPRHRPRHHPTVRRRHRRQHKRLTC
jgi:putative peptide zinc metalloprotease protein